MAPILNHSWLGMHRYCTPLRDPPTVRSSSRRFATIHARSKPLPARNGGSSIWFNVARQRLVLKYRLTKCLYRCTHITILGNVIFES